MTKHIFILATILIISTSASSQIFTGLWSETWEEEPDYEGQTGYHNHPFDEKRKTYSAFNVPPDWLSEMDMLTFDFLWNLELIPKEQMENLIYEHSILNPDQFTDQWPAWKAVHDGEKLYILLRLEGVHTFYDFNPKSFTVMVQPTSIYRHEPTFDYGLANNDIAKMNMAYGRYIELGGGNADFSYGEVGAYNATVGSSGMEGDNLHGFYGFMEETHFWHIEDDVLKAILIMDFETVLSYPSNPVFPEQDRIPVAENDTIAFDIFAHAYNFTKGEIIYSWCSDRYNVIFSNYYAGRLHINPVSVSGQEVQLTITSNPPNGGTTIGDGYYPVGSMTSAYASPNEGWVFVDWLINDQIRSFDNPISLELFNNTTLVANFSNNWAQLIIEPDSLVVEMETGEIKEADIILHNHGNNDLVYSISWDGKNTSSTNMIKTSSQSDDHGYFWADSEMSDELLFEWNSINNEENRLGEVSDCNNCYERKNISFNFPLYGIDLTAISIYSNGFISSTSTITQTSHNHSLPNTFALSSMIAGYWTNLTTFDNHEANIYFKDFQNYAVIQYDNVALVNSSETVTFQIILFSTGEIKLLYKNVPAGYHNYTIGIQNQSKDIGLQVAYNENYLNNNHVVSIKALPPWISCNPHRGILQPNQQQIINLAIDAETLENNIHHALLSIRSNDFHYFSKDLRITADVTGYPEIDVSHESVNFGIAALGQKLQDTIIIHNPGGGTLQISNITTTNPVFDVSSNQLTVLPFESEMIIIEFESNMEGIFAAELIMQTNVEGSETIVVPVSAEAKELNVEFFILDELGNPLEDVYIIMVNNDVYYILDGFTNQDGYKLFENVIPGDYSYSIYWNDHPSQSFSLSVIDESLSITHHLLTPEVWFESPESGHTYVVGQDDFVPITIGVKGYSYLSYVIYASGEGFEYECFILTDLINSDAIHSINAQFQLTPYTHEGNYSFSIWYIDLNSNQYKIYSDTITIINNSTVIDALWPDQTGISVHPDFPIHISWMSYNIDSVNIYYSLENTNEWILIAENVESETGICGGLSNYYFWHIPADIVSETTPCRLKFENAHNPSIYSISELFHLISTTSVQVVSSKEVKIFPNPTNNMVTISSPSKIDEFTIFDTLGRTILSKTGLTESEIKLDVSSFVPGLYIVKTIIDGKMSYTRLQVID